MPGYIIADIEVKDSATFEQYRQQVVPSLTRYGGKYLVRGGRAETLEGSWEPRRLVVVQFESAERARQWWASQEYQAPKQLRQRAAITNLVVVEGVPGSEPS